jgi:LPXTG-site transpeptidase (sortase) family protein
MQKLKIFLKKEKPSGLIIAIIFIFFVGTIFFVSFKTTRNNKTFVESTTVVEAKTIKIKDNPTKLEIPSIKVSSNIESIGLTSSGAMDAPVGPSDTGWYNLGPIPGEIGSAVIDGHSGFKGGVSAVFDNLYKIKVGDKVNVINDKGITTTFIVRKISKYDPDANATEVFSSTDSKAHLNLITCTGDWNAITKSHTSRLVVFTDKI